MYRILCDENVAPQTVRYLERDGHEATHVGDALSLSADDDEIAAYAREHDCAILTNDTDFLAGSIASDVSVLLFTNNRVLAYDLATMVSRLTNYYPSDDDLPGEFYLSEENV